MHKGQPGCPCCCECIACANGGGPCSITLEVPAPDNDECTTCDDFAGTFVLNLYLSSTDGSGTKTCEWAPDYSDGGFGTMPIETDCCCGGFFGNCRSAPRLKISVTSGGVASVALEFAASNVSSCPLAEFSDVTWNVPSGFTAPLDCKATYEISPASDFTLRRQDGASWVDVCTWPAGTIFTLNP